MIERKHAIIELFHKANGQILISSQLAAELNVSPKTIRTDIKKLNDQLQPYGLQIESIRGKGYLVKAENQAKLERFYQDQAVSKATEVPANSDERVKYLLEYLLFQTDFVKIEDLTTELYVSRSTLQVDLNLVRNILKDYGLSIEQKPHYGIKIIGKEMLIRFCISEYVFHKKPQLMEEQWLKILLKEKIDVIKEAVLKNTRKYKMIISDIGLNNLLTHLAIAYKRLEEQQPVQMIEQDIAEIKDGKEFHVAKAILHEIESNLHTHFPQNEIVYLSIHLKGMKVTTSINANHNIQALIDPEIYSLAQQIVRRIDANYNLGISDDRELLINLSLHLKPAINRYRYQMNMRNPMLEEIKLNFPLSFEAALTGVEVVYEAYRIRVNEDEVGYIALHVEAAQEKVKKVSSKKRCFIVCASGLGSAQLLLHKIENEFGNRIEVLGTADYYHLKKLDVNNIDFIISTIPIEQHLAVPVINVNTIFGSQDVSTIETHLAQPSSKLEHYIFKEYTFLNHDFQNSKEVIRFLTEHLVLNNQADASYQESVLERERQAPTSFGNLVALPHPLEPGTKMTFLSVLTLKKPMEWGGKQVQLILLLNVNQEKKEDLKPLFKSLVRLIDQKKSVFNLLACQTFEQFYQEIKKV